MPVSRENQAISCSVVFALMAEIVLPPVGCRVNLFLPPIGCFLIFLYFATHMDTLGGMADNETRLSQRHSTEILEDLKRVSDETGLSQVALVAACIRGLAKTWDEQRELTFPFRVIPESTYKKVIPLPKSGKNAKKEK